MPKMILEYKKAVISKIIETALEIFSTKGYQELTMDEIAKRLGVSKGALYSYFTSKDDILKEIYKNGRQIIQKTFTPASECNDFKEATETIFQQITQKYQKDIVIYFEILALSSHNENFRKMLKADYEEDLRVIQIFIEKFIGNGQISSVVDTGVLVRRFRSVWIGVSERLVLGFDKMELYEGWKNSTASVFGLPQ